MGSGKSSIGKQLAKQLQYDCLDTDALIVAKTGEKITALFETEDESGSMPLMKGFSSALRASLIVPCSKRNIHIALLISS